jgi:regulator of cell morphogenesis and NO signaling
MTTKFKVSPTDELKKEHVSVLELLQTMTRVVGDEQRAAPPDWAASFDKACAYFQQEVRLHFRKEEDALFPAMEKYVGRAAGPIAVMLNEHRQHNALLSQLCAAVTARNWVAVRSVWPSFTQLLTMHIMKEDTILFPMAERMLSAAEREEVGRKMEALNRSFEASPA